MDVDVPRNTEAIPISLQSLQKRYILTLVGNQQLVFPAHWVAEIILIQRSQILNLPFYNSLLLGVIHHQGSIIPLVSIQLLNKVEKDQIVPQQRIQEKLTAIRLSQVVGELSGVGLIVEQVIGSISYEQLLANQHKATASSHPQVEVFQLDRIWQSIWQPH
jgi:chemotaxis signal transduction protein